MGVFVIYLGFMKIKIRVVVNEEAVVTLVDQKEWIVICRGSLWLSCCTTDLK